MSTTAQTPNPDQLSTEDLAALSHTWTQLANAGDPRAEKLRSYIGQQTDSILHPQQDPPGAMHRAWDWLNKGLIDKDTFTGAISGMTPDQLNKALAPSPSDTPGLAAAREFTRGTINDISNLASSFTSPLAVGTMGAGAVSKVKGTVGAAARAVAGAAAAGFGAQGASQVVRAGTANTPGAWNQRLQGAGQALLSGVGAAESIPKGTGAAIATAAGKAVEPVSAAITQDPHELMTRAIKPTSSNTKWNDDIKTAMPELKAAEQARGTPVQGVDDLLDTVAQAKKNVWDQYQAKLNAAQSAGGATPPTINGNAIADAMEASVDKRQALLDPNLTDRVKAQADTYRRQVPLSEAEDFLQSANNDLNTYYSKSKVSQRVAAGDPSISPTIAEANTLRNSLYSKLDELTPDDDQGAADLKQKYGALSNVEKEAYRRQNVSARQQPTSLAQQINTARGYGQTALGAGAILAGHPVAGAGLIGTGLMETGVGNWLKGRQTTDSMIQRAFENYGKPPGFLQSLAGSEKGELGAPGTVQPDDIDQKLKAVNNSIRANDDTANFKQARQDLGPNASYSDVATRAQDLKSRGVGSRRSAQDTAQDVRQASAKDPRIADAEARQKGRAAEMRRKYPVASGALSSKALKDFYARQ